LKTRDEVSIQSNGGTSSPEGEIPRNFPDYMRVREILACVEMTVTYIICMNIII